MYLLYQDGTIGQVGNLSGGVWTSPYVHESSKQLTPVFDFARCCGRRKMKYLIRRWVKMKGKRERIHVRWWQRGRAAHSSSYMPTEKCSIPTMHIQGAGEFRRDWIKACVKSQA